jgi:hypothetical protein
MVMRGHTYALRGNQLLNGDLSQLQARDGGNEAAHSASLQSLDQVCCILTPGVGLWPAIEIWHSLNSLRSRWEPSARTIFGFIVTAASSVWQNAPPVKKFGGEVNSHRLAVRMFGDD